MQRETGQLFQILQKIAAKYFRKSFVMTSGDRSCAKQLEISGAHSYHVNGHAFDAILQPYNAEEQRILGEVAETLGFRWGGNFKNGRWANDVVHFDNGRRYSAGYCGPNR